eukprot:CAMPEP_0113559950 /NCGR_PEP_ID=MMETSP0015_2-20120614/19171_1 /TAXON_ID=2838 /ORGANISM="Odontella" /LENGTH=168 /DNA_ID=CAMNT_0000461623 /DNA_START=39 /DNA_END=545 /DNA_ORIENTATION=- /assembly_acc=CAM_ASM_000160
MSSPSFRTVLVFLACSIFALGGRHRGLALAQDQDDLFGAVVDPLWQKFEELPPKGKFATGAFAGFAATRIAVGTVTKTIKFAGAAFIASEVMNAAGVFDKIDIDISEEQSALLGRAKRRVTSTVNGFRQHVRQQLTPAKVQANIESALQKERMATIGAAAGAFAGCIL